MIKVKVAEAFDVVLDYMVAMALGHNIVWDGIAYWISDLNTSKLIGSKWKACGKPCGWSPSNYWEHGGSIIDQERISCHPLHISGTTESGAEVAVPNGWACFYTPRLSWQSVRFRQAGTTLLIAAMRCYVTSKLGEEVEVPDELLEEV